MKNSIVSILVATLTFCGGCGIFLKMEPQPHPLQAATPEVIIQPGEVRSLPGKVDNIPMFNSNSPEWVKKEGILLSTFPTDGKAFPEAHLNYSFNGKFELFAHHFVHTPPESKTLYLGIIVHNPGTKKVTLDILAAASYLMEPDAPFKQKPPLSENPEGEVYSGPGIRAVDTVLRGVRQAGFPNKLVIPPGESRMLLNHPIPVKGLERPVNGRSTFAILNSRGDTPNSPAGVYVASLAMYAKQHPDGREIAPTLVEWQQLLNRETLAQPRDKMPTPPDQVGGQLIYSRVAGVQQGSLWAANLADEGKETLEIPEVGTRFSYVISTVRAGTLGTKQVQAAKLLVRYPDTAYESHGNYGLHYDLNLPLFNPTNTPQTVTLTLATPNKEERLSQGGLMFRQPSWDFPYFRGTVRLRYRNEQNKSITRYVHLWQRRGQQVEPLLSVTLKPQEKRTVRVDFRYPPDATPPQVLTVKTVDKTSK
ncbi:DUF3370 domain-containing protein [Capilliphycus salinus ALCB114379]|uniref:DUF3370 domain-containing protein n=1 Tax=Capilliphycus salinus TaxID=2768948 RepID=UPI0039A5ED10